MMLMFNLKCFILILLGLFIVQDNNKFMIAVTLKTGQDIPADLNSMSTEDLAKLAEKEGVSLDPNAPDSPPPAAEPKDSSSDELIKSLSSISVGDISKLNMEELKGLAAQDKTYEGKSCDNIKQMGQQKDYCEKKYLLASGEEKTVDCMKSFCTDCCKGVESCEDKCHKTHAMFGDHDPEEMLISVCSYKDQGPQFNSFCKSMLTDSDPKEYDNCLTNFCFDCCSNELKINDQNDPEVMKCLDGCKPPKPKEEEDGLSPVPGSKDDNMPKSSMGVPGEEEMKALADSPQDKKSEDDLNKENDSLIKDLQKENGSDDKEEIKILADFGSKKRKSKPDTPLPHEEEKIKPHEDENKDKKKNNLSRVSVKKNPVKKQEKNKPIKKEEKFEEIVFEPEKKSTSKEEKNDIEVEEKINITAKSKPSDKKIIKPKSSNGSNNIRKIFSAPVNTIHKRINKSDSLEQIKLEKLHKKKENKKSEIGEAEKMYKKEKSQIKHTKLSFSDRTNENIKVCENLILSFSNIKHFGKNINSHCETNYSSHDFESYGDCLNNLCKECCKFLDEKKEIIKCTSECKIKYKTESTKELEFKKTKENKSISSVKNDKISESDDEFLQIKPEVKNHDVEKEDSEEKFNDEEDLKIKEDSDSDIIKIKNKEKSEVKYFELIKSICNTKYFRDCHETLCEDFCNNISNVTNLSCSKKCSNYMNNTKAKSNFFDYILKRHGYYEAKFDIVSNKKSEDINSDRQGLITSSSSIDESKAKIKRLKKQVMEEENNLLNLYKHKK